MTRQPQRKFLEQIPETGPQSFMAPVCVAKDPRTVRRAWEFHSLPAACPWRHPTEWPPVFLPWGLQREVASTRDAQRDLSPSSESRIWSEALNPTAWVQISPYDLGQVTEPL